MTDTTLTVTAPSVTSNSEAAKLAMRTERHRVLDILVLADSPIPEVILDAILRGIPTAQAKRALLAGDNGPVAQVADGRKAPAGKPSWKGITARVNEQQRAKRESKPEAHT